MQQFILTTSFDPLLPFFLSSYSIFTSNIFGMTKIDLGFHSLVGFVSLGSQFEAPGRSRKSGSKVKERQLFMCTGNITIQENARGKQSSLRTKSHTFNNGMNMCRRILRQARMLNYVVTSLYTHWYSAYA